MKVDVDTSIKGLQYLRELDGLQLLGIFFILFLVLGISIFFIMLKKGYINLNKAKDDKEQAREDDKIKHTSNNPNVVFFETRVWMKDRVLKRHMGWIMDAYPKEATPEDRENLEKVLRYAQLESSEFTNYIIKRNQFGKMTKSQFDEYLKNVPMDIITHVSRNITSLYEKMKFTIPREKMLENTTPLIGRCIDDLVKMFEDFREMEIEDEKKRG